MHCMNCGQKITNENIEICLVCGKSSGHITPKTMREKVLSKEKAMQQEKERIQYEIVERLTDTNGDWEKKMEYIFEPIDKLDGIISDYTKKITQGYPEYNPTQNSINKNTKDYPNENVFPKNSEIKIEDLTNKRNIIDDEDDDIPSTVIIKNDEYQTTKEAKKPIHDIPYLYVVSGVDDENIINKEPVTKETFTPQPIKNTENILNEDFNDDDVKEYTPNINNKKINKDNFDSSFDLNKNKEEPQVKQEQPKFDKVPPYYKQGQSLSNQEQPQFNQGQPQFNQGQPQFNQGQPQFNQGQPKFNQGQPQFNQGQPQFNQGQPQFNQGQPQFNQGQPKFNQGQPQFNQGQPQFNQGQPQFNQGQPQFNQGQPQFNQGQPQFNNNSLNHKQNNNNSGVQKPCELPPVKTKNNSLPQYNQQFNNNTDLNYQNEKSIQSKENNPIKIFMLSFISFSTLFALCVGIFMLIPRDFKIENGILVEYTGRDTIVEIPKKVDKIADGVFENLSFIEEIIIPESVTSIGNLAFANCTSLKNVEFHNNIQHFGDDVLAGVPMFEGYTFAGSTLIEYTGVEENVIIPDFVTTIGKRAFFNNDTVKTITLPSGLITIEEVAFSSCDLLEKIIIPTGTTTIENSSFSGCNNLSDIIIPSSVKFIGSDAFSGTAWYDNLSEEFNIVGNNILIKYIGKSTDVIIPDYVTFIGNSAFRNNEFIKSVTIPQKVSEIGYQAFSGCVALETVIMNEGVTTISEGAFLGCVILKKVEFPSTITSIKRMSFRTTMWYLNYFDEFGTVGENTLIRYNGDDAIFEIPSHIKNISDEAFSDAPFVEAIIFPNTVIHIDNFAFSDLINLEKIYCIEGSYVDEYFKNNDDLSHIIVNYSN